MKGNESPRMSRVLCHVRSNAIAYLALFVALGGTGYAAVSLPANSVGNRQLKNGSVTPVKIDRHLITGSIRAWAEVNASGRLVAGEGGPKAVARTGPDSLGQYLVSWRTTQFARCAGVGGTAAPGFSNLTPGSAVAQIQPPPGPPEVQVDVYNAQGQPAALPFWVALLC
jgi:hypothetical protein